MQKLLYWLLKCFICPFQALFLCKLMSYYTLPCKDFRERSKNTSKGTIYFAQDTICGKHFPFMVMARKQMTGLQHCGRKISIHFTAQKCNLKNEVEQLETGLNLLSRYSSLTKNVSVKMSNSNKRGSSLYWEACELWGQTDLIFSVLGNAN